MRALPQVFGTVVDWRRTVVAHLQSQCDQALTRSNDNTSLLPPATRSNARTIRWADFAQDWRSSYLRFTSATAAAGLEGGGGGGKSAIAYKSVDEHHLDSLNELIAQYGVDGLWTADEIHSISRIWHFLQAWPDAASGLAALNELGLQTSTLSNGNRELLMDLCKHATLPFTVITSADEFGSYKPHPSVYLGACAKLGLQPGECALVAAHLSDLQAAKRCGLRTVYVQRKREEAWSKDKVSEAWTEGWVDLWVESGEGEGGLVEVARRLGGRVGLIGSSI